MRVQTAANHFRRPAHGNIPVDRAGPSGRAASLSERALGDTDRPDAVGMLSVGAPQMLVALFFAPFAWLAGTAVSSALTGRACLGSGNFGLINLLSVAILALAGILCFVLAALGTRTAWTNVRVTGHMSWDVRAKLRGTRAETDWFLSRLAFISSVLFSSGLAITELGAAVISPCNMW